jgi:hypothetical protein
MADDPRLCRTAITYPNGYASRSTTLPPSEASERGLGLANRCGGGHSIAIKMLLTVILSREFDDPLYTETDD